MITQYASTKTLAKMWHVNLALFLFFGSGDLVMIYRLYDAGIASVVSIENVVGESIFSPVKFNF